MTASSSKFGRQTIKIPCKVNLHLGIHTQKDQRGYHKVDSLMVPVALYDTVVVDDAPELTVTHEPQLCVLPERTTTWKAAVLLANKLGVSPDVSIDVQVHIPEKAGLGGSSADAAATLYLLAQRWGVDPLDPLVVEVAKAVGADVAFFLDPQPSLMLGAGDTLVETYASTVDAPLAIVLPAETGVVTKEAYDQFDASPIAPESYENLSSLLRDAGQGAAGMEPAPDNAAASKQFIQQVSKLLFNNLAPAAKSLKPQVAEVEEWLKAQPGVLGAQVSGSGSSSFALCEPQEAADAIAAAAQAKGWRGFSTTCKL
ncbi:putative 4-(cytidine 5'-diphospho)-2-C-methyl-D-erythritol kinase [Atopobium sp. ICM42b]|uniref:4-(cytidine 5'-diphospho)-2-C-methyl-D-erythritol kinase n=1 Tax=Atopobium sp. ICM42b TaxID=1190620 RepID=UPI00044A36A5|nr:4-diphosphocytidyl-2C-methyl-D-erythritol kinase [Atopobium sp. ICM42b]EWC94422.1 putative 4-(cytidine 5'-diphospho)-2-C-methyl-D-erythritol kinase [Atopobium sp. ICM42b]